MILVGETLDYVNCVRCDSCDVTFFPGRRYKCLNCYDHDLCGNCYDLGTRSDQSDLSYHTGDHHYQLMLLKSDLKLFYGEDVVEQKQLSYSCPFCGMFGFTANLLVEHVSTKHPGSSEEVFCSICLTAGKNIVSKRLDLHLYESHYLTDKMSTNPRYKNTICAKWPQSRQQDTVVPNGSSQNPPESQYLLRRCFKRDNLTDTKLEKLDEKRASKSLFAQEILLSTLNNNSVDCNGQKIKSTLVDQLSKQLAENKICDSPAIASSEDSQTSTSDIQNGSEGQTGLSTA